MNLIGIYYNNPKDTIYCLSNNIFLRNYNNELYYSEWKSDINPEFTDLLEFSNYELLSEQDFSTQEEMSFFLYKYTLT